MKPLPPGTYTRQEMEEIFHTTRLDSIKRSLDRAGYKYEITGRGKNAVLTIIEQPTPDPFVVFAMEELGCGRATRFDDMKVYYRLLFTDADFRYYPFPYQAIIMGQHNISVSGGTLTNWKNKLFEKGLIVKDTTDYRYFLCKAGKKPQEISREEFSTIWQACFKHTKNGTEQPEAIKNMSNEHGGIPNKICGFYESALERERIDKLRSLLDV